jgi:hypothetical protein
VIPRPIDVPAKLVRFDLDLRNTELNRVAKSDNPFEDAIINDGKMSYTAGHHLLQGVLNAILRAANSHLRGHYFLHGHCGCILTMLADSSHDIHGGHDPENLARVINHDGEPSPSAAKQPCRGLQVVVRPQRGRVGLLRCHYMTHIHGSLRIVGRPRRAHPMNSLAFCDSWLAAS